MKSGTGAIGVGPQSDLGNGKRKQETDTAIILSPSLSPSFQGFQLQRK